RHPLLAVEAVLAGVDLPAQQRRIHFLEKPPLGVAHHHGTVTAVVEAVLTIERVRDRAVKGEAHAVGILEDGLYRIRHLPSVAPLHHLPLSAYRHRQAGEDPAGRVELVNADLAKQADGYRVIEPPVQLLLTGRGSRRTTPAHLAVPLCAGAGRATNRAAPDEL